MWKRRLNDHAASGPEWDHARAAKALDALKEPKRSRLERAQGDGRGSASYDNSDDSQ
ncbi:hypothetical protein GCM10023088_46020 [Actinomadura verrucosospora]